jgi:hypothetical protein
MWMMERMLSDLSQQNPAGVIATTFKPALGKSSVHWWTAKQFWVDRQSFMQKDNIYCLENVQINKLNVYLQFKFKHDVCYTYESCLYIFPIIKLN